MGGKAPQRLGFGSRLWQRAKGFLLVATLGLSSCQAFPKDATLVILASQPPAAQQAAFEHLEAEAERLGVVGELRAVPLRVLQESVFAFDPQGSGKRWDLALVPASWLERLARQKTILEVPAYHVQELQRAVAPLALLAVSWEGSIWGYPVAVEAPALIYNPALFPTPPATLAAVAQAALPEGVLPLGVELTNLDAVLPLLAAAGGLEDPRKLRDLGQGWDAFLASIGPALARPESLALWVAPNAQAAQAQLFAEGKLAAFVGGAQAVALLRKLGVPRGVVPLPPPCERCPQPRPWARCTVLVVSSACPYPDLAQVLAAKLASSRRNLELTAAMGALPVLGGEETGAFLVGEQDMLGFFRALSAARLAPPEAERASLASAWEAKVLSLSGVARTAASAPGRARL